jgi:hypothetical protein
MLRSLIILLLLFSNLSARLWAVQEGDEAPWFVSETVLQCGPELPVPFALEQYRGGCIALVCWSETGRSKRLIHEELAELTLRYRRQGVLVLGLSDDERLVREGFAEVGQRAPIIIVSAEDLKRFGPFEDGQRRLVIDGRGLIAAAPKTTIGEQSIPKGLELRTPYGRWQCLERPWFATESRVARFRPLQQLVNQGRLGAALDKARKWANDKDLDLAGESAGLVERCQTWIDEAQEIETAAQAAGDVYMAAVIAEELAAALKGDEAADAAADRAKAYRADPACKAGKVFYPTWQKGWGRPVEWRQGMLRSLLKKQESGYYRDLIATWLGEG